MKRGTSQLLALSFDTPASPWLVLLGGPQGEQRTAGWGVAWYPADDDAAMVIKDPRSTRDTSFAEIIGEWDRFRSTLFVSHIRGAAKRTTQQDTHPFVRSYARRNFVFAHVGDLDGDYRAALPLGEQPIFEPLGTTDSEHIFCWLLTSIRQHGARTLAELGWPTLQGLFQEIDSHGTANMVLTDGIDLVAYRGADGHSPLCWQRRLPPLESKVISNDYVEVHVSDTLDHTRTILMVATTPLEGGEWNSFEPGEMLAARRASVQWRNRDTQPATTKGGDAPGAGPVVVGGGSTDAVQPAPDAVATGPRSSAESAAAESADTQTASATSPDRSREHESVYSVFHETVYTYTAPVEHSVHSLRLQPVHDPYQELLDSELEVTPSGPSSVYEDVFGNCTLQIELKEPYQELRFVSRALVRVRRRPDPSEQRVRVPLMWMPWQRQMMSPYLLPTELPETHLRELSEYAMSFVERQNFDLLETLAEINSTIYHDYRYVSGSTTLETTPFDVFVARRGVCQDFANLFICMARLLGVPARYRVGYIHTGADYANKIQSEASHAWAEVYLPQIGWRGFDPTNGCTTSIDHIRVAVGRNYRDATPTGGTIYRGGQGETLSVNVRVEPR